MSPTGLRRAVIALILFGAVLVGCQWATSQWTTIRLPSTDYEATFTIAWGTGMDERLTLSRGILPWHWATTGRIEIWKKPYNSGMTAYVADDGTTFYFGAGYRLFRFRSTDATLTASCDAAEMLQMTDLTKQLRAATPTFKAQDAIDPGGTRLFDNIPRELAPGPVPETPPPSKYYVGLKYLGRFGLSSERNSGSVVRFIPATNAPEPRMGLHAGCG